MAKYNKGILGGFSGKVGNVIGASWKGIEYMRSRPTSYSDPKTEPQLAQRQRFSLVMSFLRKVKPVVNIGFLTGSPKMNAINRASSFNLKNATTGVYPDQELDYTKMLVTRGDLLPAENGAVEADSPTEIVFTWDDNSGWGSAEANDPALLLLYNVDKDRALYLTGGGPNREDGAFTMPVPSSFEGDTLQAYIAFVSDDYAEASDSEYLGSVVVPVGP